MLLSVCLSFLFVKGHKLGSESFTRWLPSPSSLPSLTLLPFAPFTYFAPFAPLCSLCPFAPFTRLHPLSLTQALVQGYPSNMSKGLSKATLRHVQGYPQTCPSICPNIPSDMSKDLSKYTLRHVQGLVQVYPWTCPRACPRLP